MTVAHLYTVAFQGIEARKGNSQASAAKPSAVRITGKYEQAAMTVAHLYTVAFQGIDAHEVGVQVHIRDSTAASSISWASPTRQSPKARSEYARPDTDGLKLLGQAATAMPLTARGYHRVLKVARTIADLAGEAEVRRAHVAEVLSYRGIANL